MFFFTVCKNDVANIAIKSIIAQITGLILLKYISKGTANKPKTEAG